VEVQSAWCIVQEALERIRFMHYASCNMTSAFAFALCTLPLP
jgi:hypothetical protein